MDFVPTVEAAVYRLNQHLPKGAHYDFYHWTNSDSEKVWTADRTWQEDIPRTSDPNCPLVICLFGERLGEMLPDFFPWPQDLTLPEWASWPHREAGKVPVTGTVYEVIDRLLGPKNSESERKILCLFKMDEKNLADKHVQEVRRRYYGFLHEYNKLCGDHRWPPSNVEKDYYSQLNDLDAFVKALFRNGARRSKTFGSGTAENCQRELSLLLDVQLPKLLGVEVDLPERDPKGLFSYEPGDADILFGRDPFIDSMIDFLAHESHPVLLTGRSGEGKSSVLRAGLAGRLGKKIMPLVPVRSIRSMQGYST